MPPEPEALKDGIGLGFFIWEVFFRFWFFFTMFCIGSGKHETGLFITLSPQ
jgi:hypothetical protein